jgi:hypothetical protein
VPRAAPQDPRRRRYAAEDFLAELARIRAPLYHELERLRDLPGYRDRDRAHLCCTRRFNRMRISPLEARAIARAFETEPELRRKLPAVLARLEKELTRLEDTSERQPFDCPLLEGTRCLVHDVAKPIGCLAWHPPDPQSEPQEYTFTRRGWDALARRDELNDRFVGPWRLRVFARRLKQRAKRRASPQARAR